MKLIKTMGVLMMGILMVSMVVGCDSSDETPTVEPTPTPPSQTEPDFIGNIIEVHANGTNYVLGTILVEGTDVIQSSDKYDVTIKAETLILGQDGKNATFAEFKAGQQVGIWFSGPVMESYPAQVDAAQVIVIKNDPVVEEDPGIDKQVIGNTPAGAGYFWDAERKGWCRHWDSEFFVSSQEKPEWDKFIPASEVTGELIVDESASGTEVKLAIGESVIVKLASNPSTGFQWELAELTDETVLKQTNQLFSIEGTDPPPGTPGKESWVFEAIGAGTSTISMEYSRPWEGGEKAVEIFTLTVIAE